MLTTELVILVVCVIGLAWIGYSYEVVLAGLFVVAVTFPVLFYHHSWSFWLCFDYLIEGLPKIPAKHYTSK
jgi:Na+/H+ antiporter NhaC